MTLKRVVFFLKLCGLLLISQSYTTEKPKAGPYISTPVELKRCAKPTLPYLQSPAVTFTWEPMKPKKSVLKGNITILKSTKDIKTSIKEFYFEDGKWHLTFKFDNLSCRSKLMAVIMETFKVVYDKKTCTVPKGIYRFEVNYNTLYHMWVASKDYGRLLRRIESSTKTGTIVCLEFEEIVGPETH